MTFTKPRQSLSARCWTPSHCHIGYGNRPAVRVRLCVNFAPQGTTFWPPISSTINRPIRISQTATSCSNSPCLRHRGNRHQPALQDCQPVCSACDQTLPEGVSAAALGLSGKQPPHADIGGRFFGADLCVSRAIADDAPRGLAGPAHDQPDGVRVVHLGSRSQRASDDASDFGTRRASGSAARNISGEFGGRSVAADCDAGQLTTCLEPTRRAIAARRRLCLASSSLIAIRSSRYHRAWV